MARFERVFKPLKEIMINNFFGGLAWAVGATVGFSIIIFLLNNVFESFHWIPVIGDFISNITKYVLHNLQTNPQLIK